MEREGRLALSVDEVAKKLGVARNSLYQAIKTGEIPSIKVGKRILIPLATLQRLLSGTGDS